MYYNLFTGSPGAPFIAKPVTTPMIAGKHPAELTRVRVSSQDAQVEPSETGTPTLKLGETFQDSPDKAALATPGHRAAIKPSQSPKCAPPVAAAGPTPGAVVPADKGWKDLARTPASKRSRSSRKLPSPNGSAVASLHVLSIVESPESQSPHAN